MLQRIPKGLLIGVLVAFVAIIVLAIVSAILPGVDLNVLKWAGIVGVLAGLVYVVTGENIAS